MGKDKNKSVIKVDYPRPYEKIFSKEYTFRIRTQVEGPVEVSVDGEPWQSCRESVGYWWFDWAAGRPGLYKLSARVLGPDGRWAQVQAPRSFRVAEPVTASVNGSGRKALSV